MSVDNSKDVDPEETAEWLESFEGLVKTHGRGPGAPDPGRR